MTAEFDWWLLIVGLVVGAGLVWLILAEWPRRDEELADAEVGLEAGWIAAQLRADGRPMEPETAEAVLRQHRVYLRLPPPDDVPAPSSPLAVPAPAAATASSPSSSAVAGPMATAAAEPGRPPAATESAPPPEPAAPSGPEG